MLMMNFMLVAPSMALFVVLQGRRRRDIVVSVEGQAATLNNEVLIGYVTYMLRVPARAVLCHHARASFADHISFCAKLPATSFHKHFSAPASNITTGVRHLARRTSCDWSERQHIFQTDTSTPTALFGCWPRESKQRVHLHVSSTSTKYKTTFSFTLEWSGSRRCVE